MASAGGGTQEPYLKLPRTIPVRLRQLHIDLVYERVFMLAYSAHVHYSAIVQIVNLRADSDSDPDPFDVPSPSIEEIGKGSKPGCWCVQRGSSQSMISLSQTS